MADAPSETAHTSANRHRDGQAGDAKRTAERFARDSEDTIAEGGETAKRRVAETARESVEQARDFTQTGLDAAAGFRGRVAEIGRDQGIKGMKTAARVVDIYRETTESTAEDVQALIEAFSNIGRGVQQMQHAWFDILNRSIDQAARRPQDLLRCKSPIELAEAQRDLYREGVSYMVNATTTWLNLMAQTAQQAGRPLEQRGQRHA